MHKLGAQGQESHQKVQEQLLNGVNTKLGQEMAHTVLNEAEPPPPVVALLERAEILAVPRLIFVRVVLVEEVDEEARKAEMGEMEDQEVPIGPVEELLLVILPARDKMGWKVIAIRPSRAVILTSVVGRDVMAWMEQEVPMG